MIGANTAPTLPVPRFWNANSSTMMTAEIGTMKRCRPGAITSRPSTAPSTEIAGVITPSPKNSAAPNRPSMTIHQRPRWLERTLRWASAVSAMMPPSPLLSARMMKPAYFTDTTRISDQNTSDSTPSTFGSVGVAPCTPKVCLMVYRGLVPMSP